MSNFLLASLLVHAHASSIRPLSEHIRFSLPVISRACSNGLQVSSPRSAMKTSSSSILEELLTLLFLCLIVISPDDTSANKQTNDMSGSFLKSARRRSAAVTWVEFLLEVLVPAVDKNRSFLSFLMR